MEGDDTPEHVVCDLGIVAGAARVSIAIASFYFAGAIK
jgi:hypothetical protein